MAKSLLHSSASNGLIRVFYSVQETLLSERLYATASE